MVATLCSKRHRGVENISTSSVCRPRKVLFLRHFKECLAKYNKMILFSSDNVPTRHLQHLRALLRGKAELVFGKNTLMRKALNDMLESNESFSQLLPHLKGNVGFLFAESEEDLFDLSSLLSATKITASAKVGSVSPCDVVLNRGPTQLGPEKTSFFRAVGIATRITRGCVEILNSKELLKEGDRVDESTVALLNLLDIQPFSFGLKVKLLFDEGDLLTPDACEQVTSSMAAGMLNLLALCKGGELGLPPFLTHFGERFSNVPQPEVLSDQEEDGFALDDTDDDDEDLEVEGFSLFPDDDGY
eukprot:CAMPEP_0174275128 /NCGR_PEP_ID=MMETSP0439-20130205/59659_1 /TAXON_ID=0 /ORGANISM="Stereomyxa ramosa, Strain Chinc5" /LENGTH=301 /DNA_ID=CAMNT_0015367209 /DNA_START=1781 /DNA_END=2686 /DNA_ORIENTATION=+